MSVLECEPIATSGVDMVGPARPQEPALPFVNEVGVLASSRGRLELVRTLAAGLAQDDPARIWADVGELSARHDKAGRPDPMFNRCVHHLAMRLGTEQWFDDPGQREEVVEQLVGIVTGRVPEQLDQQPSAPAWVGRLLLEKAVHNPDQDELHEAVAKLTAVAANVGGQHPDVYLTLGTRLERAIVGSAPEHSRLGAIDLDADGIDTTFQRTYVASAPSTPPRPSFRTCAKKIFATGWRVCARACDSMPWPWNSMPRSLK